METNEVTGWVKLYHPIGAQVTLPVPVQSRLSVDQAADVFASVSAYIDAGFQVDAPGLEEGEHQQEVVSVSRRESKDQTPIVAFYLAHPKALKKFMHVYLNHEEDVQAFETATGLRLNAIPLWPGDRDIDKDHRDAGTYIVPLSRPIKVIWEISPKWQRWSEEGGKATGSTEPHKLLLVRYDAGAPAMAKPTLAPAGDAPVVRKYADGSDANPAAFAIYDAFLSQRKAAPLSAEGLKAWYANPANKALVKLPQPA